MPYTLVYHPSVFEEDLPPLPLNVQHRIAHALAERTELAHEQRGTPLKRSLNGQTVPGIIVTGVRCCQDL